MRARGNIVQVRLCLTAVLASACAESELILLDGPKSARLHVVFGSNGPDRIELREILLGNETRRISKPQGTTLIMFSFPDDMVSPDGKALSDDWWRSVQLNESDAPRDATSCARCFDLRGDSVRFVYPGELCEIPDQALVTTTEDGSDVDSAIARIRAEFRVQFPGSCRVGPEVIDARLEARTVWPENAVDPPSAWAVTSKGAAFFRPGHAELLESETRTSLGEYDGYVDGAVAIGGGRFVAAFDDGRWALFSATAGPRPLVGAPRATVISMYPSRRPGQFHVIGRRSVDTFRLRFDAVAFRCEVQEGGLSCDELLGVDASVDLEDLVELEDGSLLAVQARDVLSISEGPTIRATLGRFSFSELLLAIRRGDKLFACAFDDTTHESLILEADVGSAPESESELAGRFSELGRFSGGTPCRALVLEGAGVRAHGLSGSRWFGEGEPPGTNVLGPARTALTSTSGATLFITRSHRAFFRVEGSQAWTQLDGPAEERPLVGDRAARARGRWFLVTSQGLLDQSRGQVETHPFVLTTHPFAPGFRADRIASDSASGGLLLLSRDADKTRAWRWMPPDDAGTPVELSRVNVEALGEVSVWPELVAELRPNLWLLATRPRVTLFEPGRELEPLEIDWDDPATDKVEVEPGPESYIFGLSVEDGIGWVVGRVDLGIRVAPRRVDNECVAPPCLRYTGRRFAPLPTIGEWVVSVLAWAPDRALVGDESPNVFEVSVGSSPHHEARLVPDELNFVRHRVGPMARLGLGAVVSVSRQHWFPIHAHAADTRIALIGAAWTRHPSNFEAAWAFSDESVLYATDAGTLVEARIERR
ncbi:MAG: hypothetical protein HYV07_27715 [Deltaproteobacteria bacterium]|nr:hypothetical protein [Deltaproteobacteria bacterium]